MTGPPAHPDADGEGAPLRLWLARHGETDWNAEGRIQGHCDIPLNARGRGQALELASELVGSGAALVVSSDLRRAAETAEVIAARLSLPLELTDRLRERNLGELQGRTAADIGGASAGFVSRMINDAGSTPAGAETLEGFRGRLGAWLNGVRARPPATGIIVVTHGGCVRALLLALTGSDQRDAVPGIANCAVLTVAVDAAGGRIVAESRPLTDARHTADELAAG